MGPFSRFFIHDPTPAAVLVVMGRCNVATTVFSSHRAIEADASQGNDETARVVDRYPGRFAGYFVINPHQDPDGELLRWSEDHRFVGVKLHPDLHDYPITGRLYDRVLRWAAERGKPVLTHTWGGSTLDDPAMLGRVCARIPDLTLIAGHSGANPRGFGVAVEVARDHEGIILDTCGSQMTGDWIAHMVREVGPHRVVFGSDVPFLDLRYQLARVLAAPLESNALAMVLRHNSIRIFGQQLARVTATVSTGGTP
jgi:predicted TIM-barrel fold metal-dependent hydrolase